MTAISFDSSNSNAYFRKGVACFYKKEYYTAKKALEAGFSLSPTDKRFPDWIDKCK
ncbi:Cochaperone protein [Orobanche minor]